MDAYISSSPLPHPPTLPPCLLKELNSPERTDSPRSRAIHLRQPLLHLLLRPHTHIRRLFDKEAVRSSTPFTNDELGDGPGGLDGGILLVVHGIGGRSAGHGGAGKKEQQFTASQGQK